MCTICNHYHIHPVTKKVAVSGTEVEEVDHHNKATYDIIVIINKSRKNMDKEEKNGNH